MVEVHGKLLDQDGQAVKEYFLSQVPATGFAEGLTEMPDRGTGLETGGNEVRIAHPDMGLSAKLLFSLVLTVSCVLARAQ